MKPIVLYIHVPFCLHKCPYCDFNTYALASIPEEEYVAALLAELDFRAELAEWRGREVRSIYFGGGTPSLFSARSISRIVASISRFFPVHYRAEISLEANPGTLDADYLSQLAAAGINRLSLGAQSLDPEVLKTLGRMHSPQQIETAVLSAREAGFNNLNLDLIYAAPGQTSASLQADLLAFAALEPEHISAYGLTIEKGTPFYQSYKRGLLRLPADDQVVEMMESVARHLTEAGFRQYEISNYARPGFEAQHNLAYWHGVDYLGLGAGAHSFLACEPPLGEVYGMRWSNFALPARYMSEAVTHGRAEGWRDKLNREEAIFEFFFLGLRTIEGVEQSEFEQRFGVRVEQLFPFVIPMLKEQELLAEHEGKLALTQKGLLLADSVIEHFVTDGTVQKLGDIKQVIG